MAKGRWIVHEPYAISPQPSAISHDSVRPLEPKPETELSSPGLSVAAAQRREDQKVRQPLIDGRVAEVRHVENVVRLEARVDRLLARTEPIAELQIGLLERRPTRAVAPALRVDADRVQT